MAVREFDELVRDSGGVGIPIRVITPSTATFAVAHRMRSGHGRLDCLVNSAWGGYEQRNDAAPFFDAGFRTSRGGAGTACSPLACAPPTTPPGTSPRSCWDDRLRAWADRQHHRLGLGAYLGRRALAVALARRAFE